MIAIRHTGIYVNDIVKLEAFYSRVFHMYPICSNEIDQDGLFDELLDGTNLRIITTKLVTPYGKQNGQGDMLELVKVIDVLDKPLKLPEQYPISMTGIAHLAFQVDDMEQTVELILQEGGVQKTNIYQRENGNLCCFCRDPEGNWLELIKR